MGLIIKSKMMLNDNDLQRIEQFIKEYDEKHCWPFTLSETEKERIRTGAEYATRFEREQQAITEQNYVSAVKGRMDFREAFRKQRKQIQELEAERSELVKENELLEEAIDVALVILVNRCTEEEQKLCYEHLDNIRHGNKKKDIS